MRTPMVLMTEARRVQHFATWPRRGTATPLCGNRGEFPVYEDFDRDGPPICTECQREAGTYCAALGRYSS